MGCSTAARLSPLWRLSDEALDAWDVQHVGWALSLSLGLALARCRCIAMKIQSCIQSRTDYSEVRCVCSHSGHRSRHSSFFLMHTQSTDRVRESPPVAVRLVVPCWQWHCWTAVYCWLLPPLALRLGRSAPDRDARVVRPTKQEFCLVRPKHQTVLSFSGGGLQTLSITCACPSLMVPPTVGPAGALHLLRRPAPARAVGLGEEATAAISPPRWRSPTRLPCAFC